MRTDMGELSTKPLISLTLSALRPLPEKFHRTQTLKPSIVNVKVFDLISNRESFSKRFVTRSKNYL